MKMVSTNCPNCNAPLKINPELKQAACNYCGHQFLIDDEVRKVRISEEDWDPIGRAMNNARMASDQKAAKEALEKVGKIRDSYAKSAELKRRGTEMQARVQQDERRLYDISNWMKFWNLLPNSASLFIIPAGIFILSIIIAIASWYAAGGAILAGFIIAVISYFGFRLMRNNQYAEYGRLLQETAALKADLSQNNSELQKINEETDYSFVPQKYHTPDALNFIYDVLYNKRAADLSQALNLYEEECYRRNMQRMQSEQLRFQKEQAEEMRRRQEEAEEDNDDDESGGRVLSTIGKVAAAGLIFKVGHDIFKGLKDEFF